MLRLRDPVRERTSETTARLAGVALVVAGIAHLLRPGRLLETARVGYDLVLRVRFEPRDGAKRRVRSLGVVMVAAGCHLLYHGGLVPVSRGSDGE